MPDVDLPEPDAPDVPGVAPGAAAGSRATLVASIVAGLFVVLSVLLLLLLVRLKSDNDGLKAEARERGAVETTAAQVTEVLARWDAGGRDAARRTLEGLATKPVLDQYDGAMAGLDKANPVLGVTGVQARVKDVYVGNISKQEATVLVHFDLAILGSKPAVVPDHYLEVHLSRIDGRWKVDNALDINVALANLGPTGGTTGEGATTTTTTTTVPAQPSGG